MDTFEIKSKSKILRLVGRKLKTMVASGDSDPKMLELMGDKLLGHIWNPTTDKFIFKVTVNLSTSKRKEDRSTGEFTSEDIPRLLQTILTKRSLLGFVMSQYDPMGLVCPILIKLTIKLRDLYEPELSLGWDDPIPGHLRQPWIEMLTMFLYAGEIILDRAVKPKGALGKPELIAYSDGSLEAFACAIYIRWEVDGPEKILFVSCVPKHE